MKRLQDVAQQKADAFVGNPPWHIPSVCSCDTALRLQTTLIKRAVCSAKYLVWFIATHKGKATNKISKSLRHL